MRKAVLFSVDESIIELVRCGLGDAWRLDQCSNPSDARTFLVRSGVGIVVIDDAEIEEVARGWVLDRVRRWASDALIAYIASKHSEEVERSVRSNGVQFYLSRPLDRELTIRVLRSFMSAAR